MNITLLLAITDRELLASIGIVVALVFPWIASMGSRRRRKDLMVRKAGVEKLRKDVSSFKQMIARAPGQHDPELLQQRLEQTT